MTADVQPPLVVTPLLRRHPESLIAYEGLQSVTAGVFLQQIARLRDTLPCHRYAINVCRNRFNFHRAMGAVIAAGQCNLLPPNRQPATLDTLIKQYPDVYVINDDDSLGNLTVDCTDFRQLTAAFPDFLDGKAPEILINETQLSVISFTSGSTGKSQPNKKTWSMLRQGNEINMASMLECAPDGLHMLATVPPQHMYGLELSVLLPMAADVCIHSGQPLYPLDVQQALQQMPSPRALVSTPQHLRALVGSGLTFPGVERLFSATAPLSQALAQQVEACFGGRVIEIYGCSEVGSIARREPAREDRWLPFSAMTVHNVADTAMVAAPHLAAEIALQDSISIAADGSFTLLGRLADLVNIAGKRGSLGQINQHLLSIPQVRDGIIFDPDSGDDVGTTRRLAAIVVVDGLDKRQLLGELKKQLDPVFLPRPILFTDHLPRSDTSKLPRQVVLDLYRKLREG